MLRFMIHSWLTVVDYTSYIKGEFYKSAPQSPTELLELEQLLRVSSEAEACIQTTYTSKTHQKNAPQMG